VHIVLLVEKVWTKIMMKQGLREFPKNNITVIYADDLLNYDERERALFHNKFWVFDDDIAILGGQNILDSENISTGFNHQSRDTDLLVQGPAVTDISKSFFLLLDRFNYKDKCSSEQLGYLEAYIESLEKRIILEEEQGLRGQQNYSQKLNNVNTRMDGVCRYIILNK
jgi:phosphatidylserine/phosphatidylglycerophosphate/cardiolipin synthase-like enzyme